MFYPVSVSVFCCEGISAQVNLFLHKICKKSNFGLYALEIIVGIVYNKIGDLYSRKETPMSVPPYDKFMPLIMAYLSDGKQYTLKEVSEYCSEKMNLSNEDRAETVQSGQPTYLNRIGWARTYLKKAGLIESPQKGAFCITEEGKKAIKNGTESITVDFLKKYPSFIEFKTKKSGKNSNGNVEETSRSESPLEIISNAYKELNSDLADELMEQVMKISPYDFERLVVKLLIKMGYGNPEENSGAVTQKSNDGGIDGIVSGDKFGFDLIYIQAKQWDPAQTTVGRPQIQQFLGALAGQGASKGIFITTTQFSGSAIEFARSQHHCKIVLVDGKQLANLMIEYDLGVSTVSEIKIKRVDSDFFNEGF